MSSSPQKTTSANHTPPTLLALPAEIKLQILSHLSGRQIQACRRVCREFTELIDAKDDEKAVIKPIRRRAKKHRWSLLRLMSSRYKRSLPTSLFTWFSCRGIWPDIERNRWIISSAAKQWAAQSSEEIQAMIRTMIDNNTVVPDVLRRATLLIVMVVEALVQLYIDIHFKFPHLFAGAADTSTRMCDVSTKRRFLRVIDRRIHQVDLQYLSTNLGLPLSKAQLERCYDRIVAHQSPLAHKNSAALLHIPLAPSPQLAVPQFVLTAFEYWYQDQESANSTGDARPPAVRIQGRCEAKDLSELLHWHVPAVCPYAAWCVRSQWADDLVCQGLGGKALTEIQKAAVIEELYVF